MEPGAGNSLNISSPDVISLLSNHLPFENLLQLRTINSQFRSGLQNAFHKRSWVKLKNRNEMNQYTEEILNWTPVHVNFNIYFFAGTEDLQNFFTKFAPQILKITLRLTLICPQDFLRFQFILRKITQVTHLDIRIQISGVWQLQYEYQNLPVLQSVRKLSIQMLPASPEDSKQEILKQCPTIAMLVPMISRSFPNTEEITLDDWYCTEQIDSLFYETFFNHLLRDGRRLPKIIGIHIECNNLPIRQLIRLNLPLKFLSLHFISPWDNQTTELMNELLRKHSQTLESLKLILRPTPSQNENIYYSPKYELGLQFLVQMPVLRNLAILLSDPEQSFVPGKNSLRFLIRPVDYAITCPQLKSLTLNINGCEALQEEVYKKLLPDFKGPARICLSVEMLNVQYPFIRSVDFQCNDEQCVRRRQKYQDFAERLTRMFPTACRSGIPIPPPNLRDNAITTAPDMTKWNLLTPNPPQSGSKLALSYSLNDED